jgi:hypothetical protein
MYSSKRNAEGIPRKRLGMVVPRGRWRREAAKARYEGLVRTFILLSIVPFLLGSAF